MTADEPERQRPRPDPAGGGAGGRRPLSRALVVAAAVRFIDERGLPALTMRGLAETLGVEAMSLYKYVPSRDNLLDAVVEAVVDELYGDPEVHLQPPDGWQDYLVRLAHGVRRLAVAHPQVFPLVATRPPAAPWIRPPLRSLRWIDAFLAALEHAGFGEEQVVYAYKAFSSFLLGHLLLEVSAHGVPVGPEETTPDDPAAVPGTAGLESYPAVARYSATLSADTSTREFEEALESLLDRLDRRAAHRSS